MLYAVTVAASNLDLTYRMLHMQYNEACTLFVEFRIPTTAPHSTAQRLLLDCTAGLGAK